jgi:hypothetical protein
MSQFHLLGDGTPEELATPPSSSPSTVLQVGGRDLRASPLVGRRPALERGV